MKLILEQLERRDLLSLSLFPTLIQPTPDGGQLAIGQTGSAVVIQHAMPTRESVYSLMIGPNTQGDGFDALKSQFVTVMVPDWSAVVAQGSYNAINLAVSGQTVDVVMQSGSKVADAHSTDGGRDFATVPLLDLASPLPNGALGAALPVRPVVDVHGDPTGTLQYTGPQAISNAAGLHVTAAADVGGTVVAGEATLTPDGVDQAFLLPVPANERHPVGWEW